MSHRTLPAVLLAAAAGLLLAGCADTAAVRSAALQTQKHVGRQSQSLQAFVAMQTQLNVSMEGVRQDYLERTADSQRASGLQLDAWTRTQAAARLQLYKDHSAVTADQVLAAMPQPAPAPPALDGSVSKTLDTASDTLGQLAAPSSADRLRELLQTGAAIYDGWQSFQQAAAATSVKTTPEPTAPTTP